MTLENNEDALTSNEEYRIKMGLMTFFDVAQMRESIKQRIILRASEMISDYFNEKINVVQFADLLIMLGNTIKINEESMENDK